jgi:glucokinase
MLNNVLLIDIGGTYVRVNIVTVEDLRHDRFRAVYSAREKITDKKSLLEYLHRTVVSLDKEVKLISAVLSFAGPIINNTVEMINWTDRGKISKEDIKSLITPATNVRFLNDMEAAAYGMLARNKGFVQPEIMNLYEPTKSNNEKNGNILLLMPGTGMGVSAIFSGKNDDFIIACEMQHSAIPVIDKRQEQVLNIMKHDLDIEKPSWEEFISGPGLESIYRCLGIIESGENIKSIEASEIARSAVQGQSDLCAEALSMYYQCCGALVQSLALTFMPYGGIYIAGTSTQRNRDFIVNSRLLEQYLDNKKRNELLQYFPINLMLDDLNLYGAAYVAKTNVDQ